MNKNIYIKKNSCKVAIHPNKCVRGTIERFKFQYMLMRNDIMPNKLYLVYCSNFDIFCAIFTVQFTMYSRVPLFTHF